MTNQRRRRQTRTRLITGYPPELHNAGVAHHKAIRDVDHSIALTIRTFRSLRNRFTALAETADDLTARYLERERARADDDAHPKCTQCITTGSMEPHHTPSPYCESGGYPHCTCSICY